MPISTAHSEAARRNGAKSHGPATPEGKSRSSQNARKHSLLASTALLSCEDRAALDALTHAFRDEYQPQTPTEERYVREMVDAEFRLQRVRAHAVLIQEARMQKLSSSPTEEDAAEAFHRLTIEGPSLALLLRYENQFRRQFDRSLQLLLDFRLRARTDQDKMKKAESEAYLQFVQDLVAAPMPDQTETGSRYAAAPASANFNNTNFPKEPSRPLADSPFASISRFFRRAAPLL